MDYDFIATESGRRIAYRRQEGAGRPGIVFLPGLRSDMEGTKAVFLAEFCRENGLGYLRFDYSGHGRSSGRFEDGCIGDWAEDAAAAVNELTEGPQILVGSSMGGWIALLLSKSFPEKTAGVVGIAAAPDFTKDFIAAALSPDQARQFKLSGRVELPSEYDDEPTTITKRLIEDGNRNLVLESPLTLACPLILLQGTEDPDVDFRIALRLLEHADSPDSELILVHREGHRFSSDRCLKLISEACLRMVANAAAD